MTGTYGVLGAQWDSRSASLAAWQGMEGWVGEPGPVEVVLACLVDSLAQEGELELDDPPTGYGADLWTVDGEGRISAYMVVAS